MKEVCMERANAKQAILARERSALDRWSQGDPMGYVDVDANDVTYFDDVGAHTRVDGIEAMRDYFASLAGKIPTHRYELLDPKVQFYGEIGILTLRYQPTMPDGTVLPCWKATSVYRLTEGTWRIVHAHWSSVKES
jgi:ketosteroid isomerase-like protein